MLHLAVASKTTFSLKLEPSSSGTTKNFVGATLHVTFTASYPDEVAQVTARPCSASFRTHFPCGLLAYQLRVSADKGLLPDQVADLQRLVDSTAQENVGMASVFTIAEAVKEWLLANNVDCGVRFECCSCSVLFELRALCAVHTPSRCSHCVCMHCVHAKHCAPCGHRWFRMQLLLAVCRTAPCSLR